MEPFDTPCNEEGSAFFKRRVSSILKVPKKSYILSHSEQECQVECAKTLEKRISRRVSFAATDNVHLFSDDTKSESSGTSPLQDLMTTGTQRRTQVAFTEDLSQHAKETPMHTSLRASQPWDKDNCDTRSNIGEKTVLFGADDAIMDMTQSHSVHLATDAEFFTDISVHNETSSKEKTQIFAADDGSVDLTFSHTSKMAIVPGFQASLEANLENKKTPSSLACLDTDFENFLASLFKSSSSSSNPEEIRATNSAKSSLKETNTSHLLSKIPKSHVDKENQPPAHLIEKSFNASRERGPSPGNGTMDLTKAGYELMDITQSDTVSVTSESLVSQIHSQICGNVRHISTQGEKQNESYPMPSSKCTDSDFRPTVTGISKANVPGSSLDPARMKTSSGSFLSRINGQTFSVASSSSGGVDREDNETMDITKAETRLITGWSEDDVFLPRQNQKKEDRDIHGKPSLPNSADMEVSQKPTLKMKTHEHTFKFDAEDDCSKHSVKFFGEDACVDVTESCTGSIAMEIASQNVFPQSCDIKKANQTLGLRQSLALRPSCYTGTEAKLPTALKSRINKVNLNTDQPTLRTTYDEAYIDVTQCQAVNIASAIDPEMPPNSDLLSDSKDKAVTFSANATDMNVTQCFTANIAAEHTLDFKSTRGDRTATISVDMDMTQCQTDNTVSHWATNLVSPQKTSTFLPNCKEQNFSFFTKCNENKTDCPLGNRLSARRALNPGFKSLSKRSATWANPVVVKASTASLASTDSVGTQLLEEDMAKTAPPRLVPASTENLENVIVANPSGENMAEAQSNSTLGLKHLDDPTQCALSAQTSPLHFVDTTETKAMALQKIGSLDLASPPPRESKRMSLADLQSKVKRLSQLVNAPPGHTVPLPQLEHDLDWHSKYEGQPMNETEPKVASGELEGGMQANCSMEEDQTSASTSPFKLKSTELVSRLSVGDFKPRLPKRGKAIDAVRADHIEDNAKLVTPGIGSKLMGLDCNVSDLYDEELESCEDVSENLETESPTCKATKTTRVFQKPAVNGLLENEVLCEGHTSDTNIKKRPLTSDEDDEEQKKRRTSTEMATDIDMDLQSHHGESESSTAPAAFTATHTTDEYNSSHTASGRYESTFESTLKQSLLEDYAEDMQKKFDDGTITVKEFFKIFNIDFVIHNPRQSILPERLTDTEHTPMDLLKDRYICRPKQLVYESDIHSLKEKVDGLKGRMQDLDQPLQMMNRSLWEELCSFSEDELKYFGAKLKEQNNLFRKKSKAQSHQMKEGLYSNIVQANEEAQQSLKKKIDEADKIIKTLDDCIDELKTELTAVEEKGSKDLPSLKWHQEEIERVNVALAERERQIFELESENTQNTKKLDKLKTETVDLQSYISTLHLLTEWRVSDNSDNSTTFTFLYKTFHLQVVYQNGNVDKLPERKIIEITFKHEIDEEKTQDFGRLVHKLLSQYIEGECGWVEKYPTRRHVPMLLQDVSLVVSSCRLLGEEIRLLSTWGFMSFAILSISCVDTRVHFVFSSLKNLSKFEVTFSTSLTKEAYAINVHSFKNKYGSTTLHLIEEIVASFSPCKNLLTKIVKKIHGSLLCS